MLVTRATANPATDAGLSTLVTRSNRLTNVRYAHRMKANGIKSNVITHPVDNVDLDNLHLLVDLLVDLLVGLLVDLLVELLVHLLVILLVVLLLALLVGPHPEHLGPHLDHVCPHLGVARCASLTAQAIITRWRTRGFRRKDARVPHHSAPAAQGQCRL